MDASNTAKLTKQLVEVNLSVNKALVNGQAAEAASFFTETGTCISPDVAIARGRAALTGMFQSWIDFGIMKLEDENNFIEHAGEIVVTTCDYKCEYQQSDESISSESGKALEVFICDEKNIWRIHSICFATDFGGPQIPETTTN